MKKVLIICYNPLSRSNANGRTIQNLLHNVPQDKVMQLYFENSLPDNESNVSNFYRLTDDDALRQFLKRDKGNVIVPSQNLDVNQVTKLYSHVKTNRLNPFYRMIRNLVWLLGNRNNKKLKQWIENGKPEYMLLMSGNNPFIDKIALSIKHNFNIPLIVYNCEDYFLKPKPRNLFGIISRKLNDKYFKRVMVESKLVIYNSDVLRESFMSRFNHKGYTIYNPSEIVPITRKINEVCETVSYVGNISNARHEGLIAIANVISKWGLKLNIYGNIQNLEANQLINDNANIIYHGVVSYAETMEIIKKSDIIVHAESFAENRIRDLRHAFSTKVADTLAMGSCFFVYAPIELAMTQYLIKENCACVVTNVLDLEMAISKLMISPSYREYLSTNAYQCATKNHSIDAASNKFIDIVNKNI